MLRSDRCCRSSAMSNPDPDHHPEPKIDPSTAHLANLAKRGGRVELEALYVRTMPALIAWISVHSGSNSASSMDREDIAQEVWVRLLESLPRYEGSIGSFRGWVFGIAKHVCLERMNPRRRGNALPLAGETRLGMIPDSITSASRVLGNADSLRRFVEYVERLEPTDRLVLVHHGLEQMSCADTGVRVGLSAEAVSKRWQRLQERVRALGIGRDVVYDD